jgi:hypothetical protein
MARNRIAFDAWSSSHVIGNSTGLPTASGGVADVTCAVGSLTVGRYH